MVSRAKIFHVTKDEETAVVMLHVIRFGDEESISLRTWKQYDFDTPSSIIIDDAPYTPTLYRAIISYLMEQGARYYKTL